MEQQVSRLDLLIYAHDGRGLGHVSRSAAIGMAVRRIYPDIKVCLITGCPQTQELLGKAPLDWIKLPAYRTEVINGKSSGVSGVSGYTDAELGSLRAEHIKQVVGLFRPRVVLADHTPQGKHKELVPALKKTRLIGNTKWLLGLRGVVGNVEQTLSSRSQELFRGHYSGLLWYGDSGVLGTDHRDMLAKHFGVTINECGYVSRLSELDFFNTTAAAKLYDCLISIPWAGEKTTKFLECLSSVIGRITAVDKTFILFLGEGISKEQFHIFEDFKGCRVEHFGSNYSEALKRSRTAMIFGGYNSLVDVLSTGVPSLVVARDMKDREQQHHLARLCNASKALSVIDEKNVNEATLNEKLNTLLLETKTLPVEKINLMGAEKAAGTIASMLCQKDTLI